MRGPGAVGQSGSRRYSPIDGTCWALAAGVVRTTLTANGRTCGCRVGTSGGVLALRADGSFRIPGGRLAAADCPSNVGVALPDEVGTWRRVGSSRRLRLRTTNVAQLRAAAEVCAGQRARLSGYRTTARLSPDRQRIKVVNRFAVHVPGVSASLIVVSRTTGGVGTGERAGPPSGAVADVAEACADRIVRCLRGG